MEKKFYQKMWFMWVTLILFAPVGIFCLWKYKHLSKTPSVVCSVISALIFIAVAGSQEEPKTDTLDAAKKEVIVATTAAPKEIKKEVIAATQNPTVSPTLRPTPQLILVSAVDLSKAFEENEIKANTQYKNKNVNVTGVISDIGEMFGQTFIVLKGSSDIFVDIQCFFSSKNQIKKIADVKKGDTVTLFGVVEGKAIYVSVRNCMFE